MTAPQGSSTNGGNPPDRGISLPLVRWRGFTLQLFLYLFLPLTALLLIIVVASQSLHHNEMRALVGERNLRAVRAAAGVISGTVRQRAASLSALAQRPGSDPASPRALEESARANGFDGGLAVFDSQGTLLGSSPNTIPEILDLQRLQSGEMSAYGAKYTAGEPTARLSGPVQTADGRWFLLGLAEAEGATWLAGAFSPAALAQEALAGAASQQSALMLVSPGGEVLYASGDMQHSGPMEQQPGVAEALRGESGISYTHSGGVMMQDHAGEHVLAYSPVLPFGWGLVLEEPWEQNAGPLLSITQSAPLILAPVLIIAELALGFGIRQIIQPLQALETRARRLAAGDFDAIRSPVGGINEIHSLQDQLVDMAGALRSAQDALHGYIGALTSGLETERRWLARELHDDTLQALIALNQHVQLTLLRTSDPQQRQSLAELQARVNDTIANLRRAIGGLRPIYLEDLGLAAALGMLARGDSEGKEPGEKTSLPAGQAMAVEFHTSGPERRLSADAELALYRIAQEALNNARRHAQATLVRVELAFYETSTSLSIQDNGEGVALPTEPGAFAHHGHYGLLGMRERADLLGADLHIESAPGQGTRITVKLDAPEA